MAGLNFVIPLKQEGDETIFTTIPNLNAEPAIEKSKGLTGVEFYTTLVVSIAASAAYDVLKVSALTLATRIREYYSYNPEDPRPFVLSFNGVQYRANSEEDLKALVHDVASAVEGLNADTNQGN